MERCRNQHAVVGVSELMHNMESHSDDSSGEEKQNSDWNSGVRRSKMFLVQKVRRKNYAESVQKELRRHKNVSMSNSR